MEWFKIDDPVGCFPVHGMVGIWSMISVGLFSEAIPTEYKTNANHATGLFKGGNAMFFGIQALSCLCFIAWALITNLLEVIIRIQYINTSK